MSKSSTRVKKALLTLVFLSTLLHLLTAQEESFVSDTNNP